MTQIGLRIENIRHTIQKESNWICADVNGVEVWYESEDVELHAAPEVFASAFLIPAMTNGLPLHVEGALSKGWKLNAQKLMELFHGWWGYSRIEIQAEDAEPHTVCDGRTALFFTGGVDSFYSLLRGGIHVDDLVYVHGFDLSLDETSRFADVRRHLETVASAVDKRLLTLKTNLRKHPLIQQAGWKYVHGGALASAAYSLLGISTVVISSSYTRMASRPWGSHWQADPLWSNERLEVLHFGDQVYRSDKLLAIVDEPLVQQHLRVCWKNKNEDLNCCQCEKCVRTMLLLQTCGKLDSYKGFSSRDQLPQMIRRVHGMMAGLLPVYEDFLVRGLPLDTAKAVRALLRRSRFRLFRKSVGMMLKPGRKVDEG
jgi:hypothetical protein